MKRYLNILTLLCVGLASGASPALAQRVITDEHVQELIRAAASRVGAQAGTAAVAPPAAGQADARPTVQLTLDDAVKLALDRNLDIAVQRLNPSTFDYSIAGLRSLYRPTLVSLVQRNSATNPNSSTVTGASSAGAAILVGGNTFNGGFSQSFPWGGGN